MSREFCGRAENLKRPRCDSRRGGFHDRPGADPTFSHTPATNSSRSALPVVRRLLQSGCPTMRLSAQAGSPRQSGGRRRTLRFDSRACGMSCHARSTCSDVLSPFSPPPRRARPDDAVRAAASPDGPVVPDDAVHDASAELRTRLAWIERSASGVTNQATALHCTPILHPPPCVGCADVRQNRSSACSFNIDDPRPASRIFRAQRFVWRCAPSLDRSPHQVSP